MNKLHLLPKLNEEDLNLLLTSIECAIQECELAKSKFTNDPLDRALSLIDLFDNIQLNTIEIDSDWNYYTKV